MFRISDFSRLTRVSVKTLRHYDRLGIFTPAYVDPETRYRYYLARQVERLQRIFALRDVGFSLDHVASLLEEDPRGRAMRRLLELRRADLASQVDADRQRLAQLDARLRELSGTSRSRLPEAVLQGIGPARVASRRARVPDLEDAVEELFESLEGEVAAAGARAAGPPILLYHDRDHRETDADVEAAVPVLPETRRAGEATIRTLPAVAKAACVVYAGGYGQWDEVTKGLLAWLQTRRLTPSGPMREVYLQFGARDPRALRLPKEYLAERAEDLVTEVQIPVKSRPISGARRSIQGSARVQRVVRPKRDKPR